MTVRAFILIHAAAGLATVATATTPVATYLDVPEIIIDRFETVSKGEFASIVSLFHNAPPPEALVAIYRRPDFWPTSPSATFLFKDESGKFSVHVCEIPWSASYEKSPAAPTCHSAEIERELAERILALIEWKITYSIRSADRPRPKKYIMVHSDFICYRMLDRDGTEMIVSSDGGVDRSSAERLNRAMSHLSFLPRVKEPERTNVVGAIDRLITGIEVARQKAN